MPNFCPQCGKKIESADAKFCHGCGISLPSTTAFSEPEHVPGTAPEKEYPAQPVFEIDGREPDASIVTSIQNLEKNLEESVDLLFRQSGYTTERNVWFNVRGNRRFGIAIVARKNTSLIAIECTTNALPAGIEELNHFSEKLRWLCKERNEKWQGIFVAFHDLSPGAEQIAGENNIETWGHDEIVEKWVLFSFGRMSGKGEILDLENALPVNHDFLKVTRVDLKNRDKISVQDATLIFYPYLRLSYHFETQFRDPSHKTHDFQDDGAVIINMLDGTVLNPPVMRRGAEGLSRVLNIVSVHKEPDESCRAKKIVQELIHSQPSPDYSLAIGQDYTAGRLKAVFPVKNAVKTALDYIIAKNTHTVTYPIEKKNDLFGQVRRIDVIPRIPEITPASNDVIFVPKWTVHFTAYGTVFTREILAHSGTVLEDTLHYCPNHPSSGRQSEGLSTRPDTIAVCEECGRAFCAIHIDQCPACEKWVCKEHSVECSSCEALFCKEHALQLCPDCNLPLCAECSVPCPQCNAVVGKNHVRACTSCGITGCEKCVRDKPVKGLPGLFKSAKICKTCYGK
jgi:hypothetical protein